VRYLILQTAPTTFAGQSSPFVPGFPRRLISELRFSQSCTTLSSNNFPALRRAVSPHSPGRATPHGNSAFHQSFAGATHCRSSRKSPLARSRIRNALQLSDLHRRASSLARQHPLFRLRNGSPALRSHARRRLVESPLEYHRPTSQFRPHLATMESRRPAFRSEVHGHSGVR